MGPSAQVPRAPWSADPRAVRGLSAGRTDAAKRRSLVEAAQQRRRTAPEARGLGAAVSLVRTRLGRPPGAPAVGSTEAEARCRSAAGVDHVARQAARGGRRRRSLPRRGGPRQPRGTNARRRTCRMSEISRTALFGKLNSLAYKAIEGATVFC